MEQLQQLWNKKKGAHDLVLDLFVLKDHKYIYFSLVRL